jgi:hypothetical protein
MGKGLKVVEQRIDVEYGTDIHESSGKDGRKGDLESHF